MRHTTKWTQLSRSGKCGLFLLLIMGANFGFLILSPYIPNVFEQWLDEKYYQDALVRIDQIRKGSIRIQVVDVNGTPINNIPIEFNQTRHEFNFGMMLFHYNDFNREGQNETYARMFQRIFNFAMLPFYWKGWETPDNNPEEFRINQTIEFCSQNNITMKGHPLVWNYDAGIPTWLGSFNNRSDDEIRTIIQEHISDLMLKYAKNITYWDVINEAMHRPRFGNIPIEEFVYDCYTWARDIVPSANLIVNDYAMLGHDFGYGEMAQFFNRLNEIGTPYDIIGMQDHSMDSDWVPTYEIYQTLQGFQRLGKKIHITEFYAMSRPIPITNSWKKGVWSPENQAEYIRRFYTTAFSHPVCDAICYWGFEDTRREYKNKGIGILNSDLTPKPAYEELERLITQEWHSNGTSLTDENGVIEFRGFYGTYTLQIQGKTYLIKSENGKSNEFQVKIE